MFTLRRTLNQNNSLALRCFNVVLHYSSNRSKPNNAMNKKPVLYGDEISPPVRFVLMTASVLGVKLDFQKVDLFLNEHKTEFYKKINPLQKVPALVIDNDVICDSHAIALLLCSQSTRQDLYPADALLKARVDQMLFFNSSALFPIDSAVFSEYFAGKWPVDQKYHEQWHYLLDYLEHRLGKNKWLTGDEMSLCDLCCGTTVSSLQLLIPASDRHINVNQWMERLQEHACYSINARGLERLNTFIKNMKSNKMT